MATAIPKVSTFKEGARPEWGEAFEDEGIKWLFECYKRLIWLRREEQALQSGSLELWHADPETKIVIYRRYTEKDGNEIIVMVNFTGMEEGFEIELPRGGKYHEVLSNEDWVLEEGKYQSTIPGSTARVLKRIGG